jgi:type-F conjugative transfer system protein TrbI
MKLSNFNVKPALTKGGKILFVVLSAVLFCLCVKEYTCDKSNVALVNINAIINRYIHSAAKSNLDEKTIQENTAKFMKKLEEELHRLAQEKKIGLLVSEAILVGGVDYTSEIEHRVYRSYEGELKHEQSTQQK